MKIGLAEIPAAGMAVTLDGQRFDLLGLVHHDKADGETIQMLSWASHCATCGAGYLAKSLTNALPAVRRCETHRQPGKRVRPSKTGNR